jgi:alkylglycerol monooxygenase
VWANVEVYAGLAHDSRHARRWSDKLRVWFEPPGWRPADLHERFPKPPFVLHAIPRYAPSMTPAHTWAAGVMFMVAIGITTGVLWNAHRLAPLQLAGAAGAVLVGLWLVGRICERQAREDGAPLGGGVGAAPQQQR